MARVARSLTAVALIIVGLALAGFFGLLLGIADCGPDCVARGERVVPVVLVALGIGLAAAGALLWTLDAWRAGGWGLSLAGAASGVGCAVLLSQGSRGMTQWVLLMSFVPLIIGGLLRRRG